MRRARLKFKKTSSLISAGYHNSPVCMRRIGNSDNCSLLYQGFSDPIYAEAYVKVHGFDISLDVLLVNQTADTLQNLCLDFATLGDLKLVERPSVYTIAPHSFQSIKATIKVGQHAAFLQFSMAYLRLYSRCHRQRLVSSSAASSGRALACLSSVSS